MLALATERVGSLVGPAQAGATEVAPSAAQMSIAERSEGNMKSAITAVNQKNTQANSI
jgi:hypothetical protein